jgi:serine/threonine protein kinase
MRFRLMVSATAGRRFSAAAAAAAAPRLAGDPPIAPRHTSIAADYEVEKEELGRGAFGTVHAARCKKSGKKVAVKLCPFEGDIKARALMEYDMLRRVNVNTAVAGHANICQLIDAYSTDDQLQIVMERCSGGDLFDLIVELSSSDVASDVAGAASGPADVFDHDSEEPHGIGDELALTLGQQMLRAVEAAHKSNIAHLDVKPENFVFREQWTRESLRALTDDGIPNETDGSSRNGDLSEPSRANMMRKLPELVLIDFGASEPFRLAPYAASGDSYVPDLDDEVKLSRVGGTACYVSPEVLDGRFSSRSDVWSVGVAMYMLLTGTRPFDSFKADDLQAELSVRTQLEQITAPEAAWPPSWADEWVKQRSREKEQYEKRVKSLQGKRPADISAKDSRWMVEHAGSTGAAPEILLLLMRMLEADAVARHSATEALEEIERCLQRQRLRRWRYETKLMSGGSSAPLGGEKAQL